MHLDLVASWSVMGYDGQAVLIGRGNAGRGEGYKKSDSSLAEQKQKHRLAFAPSTVFATLKSWPWFRSTVCSVHHHHHLNKRVSAPIHGLRDAFDALPKPK